MGNRKHNIGDSMPGTVGDSEGTFHDRQNTQSFDPSEKDVMSASEVGNYLDESSEKQTSSENKSNKSNKAKIKNQPKIFRELDGSSVKVTVDRISSSGNAIAQHKGYDIHVEDGEPGESYLVDLEACIGYFIGKPILKA